jgi:oligoendopeptidase F
MTETPMRMLNKRLFSLKIRKLQTMLLVISLSVGTGTLPTKTSAEEHSLTEQNSEKYTWNLADIYPSQADFDKDYETVSKMLSKISAYRGTLSKKTKLVEFLQLNETISRKIEKLSLYAHLKQDLNIEDKKAAHLKAKIEKLVSEYATATAFMEPEILAMPKNKLNALKKSRELKQYARYIESVMKRKQHTLSKKEEALLAKLAPIMNDPENIYNNASRGDYAPAVIKNANGTSIKLTEGNYLAELEHPDREYRKRVFKAFFDSYQSIKNTSAATLYASVKADELYAKARRYKSSLHAALSADDVPEHVFTNLLSSVNENLHYLHRYIELRKNVLHIDKVHGYDMYVPLVNEAVAKKMKFPIKEAQTVILEGLKPLGKEYVANVKYAFEHRWLDVFPRDKKYTGGYNTSAYDTHPFILLNYDNSLDEMLTIAHEIGHAMNSLYTNKKQPYYNSGQSIFTAEVASTANELLMMNYLLGKAKTDEEKLYLLNKQIDQIRGTVYTQVMYSEFEKAIHDKVLHGESLTAEELNDLWLQLLGKYYGNAYQTDKEAGLGWLRVPHFYDRFYVYKYATAIAAAYELVKQMNEDKTGAATKRYLEFLSAGTSDEPLSLLKKAGVDMTSSEPITNLLRYFGSLVEEMEQILRKQGKIK